MSSDGGGPNPLLEIIGRVIDSKKTSQELYKRVKKYGNINQVRAAQGQTFKNMDELFTYMMGEKWEENVPLIILLASIGRAIKDYQKQLRNP